jgi:pyruvate formate lyase activating enzyme
MTIAEAVDRLRPLLPYLRQHGGGVTVSGGEPTLQADFVQRLFAAAHLLGLTTALDTNGACAPGKREALLAVTDTVLLDVKASRDKLHRSLTGAPLAPTLAFGRLAASRPGRLVIRRVLLPGLNDKEDELRGLIAYALSLPHRPVIELIPYHRLGVHKWKELGLRYSLNRLRPPSAAYWQRVADRLTAAGLTVVRG